MARLMLPAIAKPMPVDPSVVLCDGIELLQRVAADQDVPAPLRASIARNVRHLVGVLEAELRRVR